MPASVSPTVRHLHHDAKAHRRTDTLPHPHSRPARRGRRPEHGAGVDARTSMTKQTLDSRYARCPVRCADCRSGRRSGRPDLCAHRRSVRRPSIRSPIALWASRPSVATSWISACSFANGRLTMAVNAPATVIGATTAADTPATVVQRVVGGSIVSATEHSVHTIFNPDVNGLRREVRSIHDDVGQLREDLIVVRENVARMEGYLERPRADSVSAGNLADPGSDSW